jgi:hypothetical protein
MDAGIVHQNLHRTILQQFLHRRTRRSRIGQVKLNRGRLTAGGHYVADNRFRGRSVAMRMYIDEVTG